MANQKYDNTNVMADSGSLNWGQDHIFAILAKDATFNTSHKRFSQTGGSQVAVTEIPGRYMGSGGQAMGLPASFRRVLKDQNYQVLLVKDVGDNDPLVLSFYDVDTEAGTLRMTNNGTLILRPVALVEGQSPDVGMWLRL